MTCGKLKNWSPRALMTLALATGVAIAFSPAQAGTLTTIHNFSGTADGSNPVDGLLLGTNNQLYGTGSSGGAAGLGVVFQMSGKGTETVLHSFAGGADGATPNGGIIQGPGGTIYGTTTAGGAYSAGTVYSIQGNQEKILYSFGASSTDGATPQAGLLMDGHGNLYGTTSAGGAAGTGTVFELVAPSSANGGWTEMPLYSFAGGADGAVPVGRVNFDALGNLYGTTSQGGASGYGTVYQLAPGTSSWQENILFNFSNQTDGGTPYAGLVVDSSGALWGATTQGGVNGGGTIFKLTPANGSFTFSVPASIPGWGIAGSYRDILFAPNGTIYATTHCDGTGQGSIYKLTQSNGVWTYKVLYNFTGGLDGLYSISNLTLKGSTLYGTTIMGGTNDLGTVFGFTF